jgi:hypothetical protein
LHGYFFLAAFFFRFSIVEAVVGGVLSRARIASLNAFFSTFTDCAIPDCTVFLLFCDWRRASDSNRIPPGMGGPDRKTVQKIPDGI